MRFASVMLIFIFVISLMCGCGFIKNLGGNQGAKVQVSPSAPAASTATPEAPIQASNAPQKTAGEWYELGVKLWDEGRHRHGLDCFFYASEVNASESLDIFTKALEKNPEDWKLVVGKALAYEKLGKTQESIATFQLAGEIGKKLNFTEFDEQLKQRLDQLNSKLK